MVRSHIHISLVFIVGTILLSSGPDLGAQEYEEEALEILRLYEDGQTDTAYQLVEPLKKSARFVPAALFVRAQMTPDDRALGLYREVIALEPIGPYADDAAYQLVRRYTAKRDSLAAWTWFGMLERNFPQSPFVAVARELVTTQKVWTFVPEPGNQGDDVTESSDENPDMELAGRENAAGNGASDEGDESVDTGDSEVFTGYALQVGLLPTRAAAERRASELSAKGLAPDIFEKSVDGRTAWAVVVGPYATREAAGADKARVSGACECGAFTVLVE